MLTPLFGNVLIRPIKEEDQAGIIFNLSPQAPQRGEVISIGGGKFTQTPVPPNTTTFYPTLLTVPILVKRGDKVLFYSNPKSEIILNNERLYIVDQEEIVGVEE